MMINKILKLPSLSDVGSIIELMFDKSGELALLCMCGCYKSPPAVALIYYFAIIAGDWLISINLKFRYYLTGIKSDCIIVPMFICSLEVL